MKAIFWRVKIKFPLTVEFWTKNDQSNMISAKVRSINDSDIKMQITELTGITKFMLVRREPRT